MTRGKRIRSMPVFYLLNGILWQGRQGCRLASRIHHVLGRRFSLQALGGDA